MHLISQLTGIRRLPDDIVVAPGVNPGRLWQGAHWNAVGMIHLENTTKNDINGYPGCPEPTC